VVMRNWGFSLARKMEVKPPRVPISRAWVVDVARRKRARNLAWAREAAMSGRPAAREAARVWVRAVVLGREDGWLWERA